MKQNIKPRWLLLGMTAGLFCLSIGSGVVPLNGSDTSSKNDQNSTETKGISPVTLDEARGRARLLHETIHSTLQVIHREYYREDEGLPIPSRTLKAVFDELSRRWNIKIDWLAVNAQAMDIDHNPRNKFEKDAAAALTKGKQEFEVVENDVYRHAGVIVLSSECLKCHLPNRRSNKNRAAGLVISMPIKKK